MPSAWRDGVEELDPDGADAHEGRGPRHPAAEDLRAGQRNHARERRHHRDGDDEPEHCAPKGPGGGLVHAEEVDGEREKREQQGLTVFHILNEMWQFVTGINTTKLAVAIYVVTGINQPVRIEHQQGIDT